MYNYVENFFDRINKKKKSIIKHYIKSGKIIVNTLI